MTSLNELIETLEQEIAAVESLREVILLKQHAIIKHDYDALKEAMTVEAAAIQSVRQFEQQRLAFIAHCIDDLDSKMQMLTLNDLIQHLDGELTTVLTKQEHRLKTAMQQVSYINDQNKLLVNNSLNFIKETINIVTENRSRQLINKAV
ncbi:MAG TPA: flagellar protein FlgN [Bacteroidota bacterium]|nr:flagellar protein FlgN [Bacteroidota bacterium]